MYGKKICRLKFSPMETTGEIGKKFYPGKNTHCYIQYIVHVHVVINNIFAPIN